MTPRRDVTPRAEGLLPASWFAVRVNRRREQRVRATLQAAGIDEYFPTYNEEVRWSDRTKVVERPLFPGYLFVRLAETLQLLQISGVMGILGSNLHPTPIPDEQIDAVRLACAASADVSPSPYVVGERVTIATGPLAGVAGTITRVKGTLRLIVAIELLGRAVSVLIDAADVSV